MAQNKQNVMYLKWLVNYEINNKLKILFTEIKIGIL